MRTVSLIFKFQQILQIFIQMAPAHGTLKQRLRCVWIYNLAYYRQKLLVMTPTDGVAGMLEYNPHKQ